MTYLVYKHFNLESMLIRGVKDELAGEKSIFESMVIGSVLRPISGICFIVYWLQCRRTKMITLWLMAMMLLTNSPVGMSRFHVAALWLPVCLLFFKSLWKKYSFALLMIFAVLVLFPAMNVFRSTTYADDGLDIGSSFVLTGHFDSYQMMMEVIRDDIVTWGRQLLGVVLFFVPRSIWPGKPVSSGTFVAHEVGASWDNLAMNYFGEGYINFGIIGMLLFAVILARYNARMDVAFWHLKDDVFQKITYMIMLGMEFTILRGALMSIVAATVGYIATVRVVKFICAKKINVVHGVERRSAT